MGDIRSSAEMGESPTKDHHPSNSTMEEPQQASSAVYKLSADVSPLSLRKYTRLRTEAWQAVFHQDLVHSPLALKTCSFRKQELAAPDFHCWVCVIPNALNGSLDLEQGQWVGICVVQGPHSEAEYNTLNEPSLNRQGDRLETRWRPRGLYFQPAHRDPRLYTALEREANHWIEQLTLNECKAASREEGIIRSRYYGEIGGSTYEGSLASGARQVKTLTLAEKLEDDGWADLVARDLLLDDDFRDRKWACFEACQECRT